MKRRVALGAPSGCASISELMRRECGVGLRDGGFGEDEQAKTLCIGTCHLFGGFLRLLSSF